MVKYPEIEKVSTEIGAETMFESVQPDVYRLRDAARSTPPRS